MTTVSYLVLDVLCCFLIERCIKCATNSVSFFIFPSALMAFLFSFQNINLGCFFSEIEKKVYFHYFPIIFLILRIE